MRPVVPRFRFLTPPRTIAACESARGALCLLEPAPGVFYVRVDGSYSKDLYDRGFLVPMMAEVPRVPSLQLFVDWWDLASYDSAVRSAATEWATEHKTRVERTELLVRSRLVAMGVNTAAMLLTLRGIRLSVHAALAPFEAALQAAVASRRSRSAG